MRHVPQLPVQALLTVPAPDGVAPVRNVHWFRRKLAVPRLGVDVRSPFAPTVREQVGVLPLQSPDQPAKCQPAFASAVMLSGFPHRALTVGGGMMRPPVPAEPVRLHRARGANPAVPDRVVDVTSPEARTVSVHVSAVPLQSPDQPVKYEPAFGDAVMLSGFPHSPLAVGGETLPRLPQKPRRGS